MLVKYHGGDYYDVELLGFLKNRCVDVSLPGARLFLWILRQREIDGETRISSRGLVWFIKEDHCQHYHWDCDGLGIWPVFLKPGRIDPLNAYYLDSQLRIDVLRETLQEAK